MAPKDKKYDAIVVGGGHNGLVNGAYLAKAGLKTLILERRHLVGGAAITEELVPGFHFTTFSYALSLLRPDIIQELELVKSGFMPILMPSSFAPMENGDYLLLGQDRDENLREIMRHSRHDADAMDRYEHDMERVCQLIKPLFDRVPPNIFGKSPEDLDDLAWLAGHLRGAEQKVMHDAVRLLTGSAADFLDDYFESDILKGYLASSGIIGTKVGPMSQGSGLVLLFHSMGEHDGHFGSWAFHKGGNGGFTQVLARAAQSFGAEIILDADVDSVITKEARDATWPARPGGARPRPRRPARAGRPSPGRPGRSRRRTGPAARPAPHSRTRSAVRRTSPPAVAARSWPAARSNAAASRSSIEAT